MRCPQARGTASAPGGSWAVTKRCRGPGSTELTGRLAALADGGALPAFGHEHWLWRLLLFVPARLFSVRAKPGSCSAFCAQSLTSQGVASAVACSAAGWPRWGLTPGSRLPGPAARRPVATVRHLVLLDDSGRQPATRRDGKPLLFSPVTYLPAARPAGRGPGRRFEPPPGHQPGALHERCQPMAEVSGMPCIQVVLQMHDAGLPVSAAQVDANPDVSPAEPR